MSIKDKLSKVNLGKIVADGEAKRKVGAAPEAPKTAVGFHVESIYSDRKISEDNDRLREELQAFRDSEVTKKLDPKFIKASHWANRSEASFLTKDFDALKSEIESAGGNVQPIKVRPISGKQGEYEIVFGHRRHRACLELGIDVLALIEEIDDAKLFAEMDRENRVRADLRPYEQGLMYSRALDEGLFSSNRKLAEALGVDVGGVGKLIVLAKLPPDLLDAFSSPLDIKFDMGALLNAALQKNPDFVLSKAKELANLVPKKSANEVFHALTSEGVESLYPSAKPTVLKGKSGIKAKVTYDSAKNLVGVRLIGVNAFQASQFEQLVKLFVEK
jgi:ParB family chromosome partitioning protein